MLVAFYESIIAVAPPIDAGVEEGTSRAIRTVNFNVVCHDSALIESEIAKYLEDNSHGTRAVTIFWTTSGDTPDSADDTVYVNVSTTGGVSSLRAKGATSLRRSRPNFQITCVSTDPDACMAKAQAIYELLDQPGFNTTLTA